MPRRDDFLEAFWVPSQFGLGSADEPDTANDARPPAPLSEVIGDARRISKPLKHVTVAHSTWTGDVGETTSVRGAITVKRDRVGFRYERAIGLDDDVTQAEAAKLLQIPVMTINRWVRKRSLPSRKRNGVSVVKLRDVLRIGRMQKKPIRLGGTIITVA